MKKFFAILFVLLCMVYPVFSQIYSNIILVEHQHASTGNTIWSYSFVGFVKENDGRQAFIISTQAAKNRDFFAPEITIKQGNIRQSFDMTNLIVMSKGYKFPSGFLKGDTIVYAGYFTDRISMKQPIRVIIQTEFGFLYYDYDLSKPNPSSQEIWTVVNDELLKLN
jgi:hypothetical protein